MDEKYGPEHPRNLILELCRQFYHLGWVTGTGGGISIREGDKIFIAPSGVQKERMKPDDLFVQTINDEDIELPPPDKKETPLRRVRRYGSEGHLDHRPRHRQPVVFTAQRLEQMVAVYVQQPFTPTRVFAEQYECSLQTVRKALRRARYMHRKPARKIILSEAHKLARVRFARDYRDFDFSHAIFSDEKTFKSTETGRRHLWRVNNTRYEPKNVTPNNQSGRIVVNMWGWMSSSGPGELSFLPERANGQNYLKLLQDTMLPTVRIVYPEQEVPEIVFIQDNCPLHKCHLVQHWIDQQPNLRQKSQSPQT